MTHETLSVSLEQQIAQLLAEIPEEERAQFERYYQTRLAQALREANTLAGDNLLDATDPDEVESQLIEQLIREADGRDDPDGMGLVPSEEEEYFLIPPDRDPRLDRPIKRATSASDLRGAAAAMSSARWVALAALGLTVIVGGALFFSGDGTADDDSQVAGAILATPEAAQATKSLPMATPTPLAALAGGGEVSLAFPTSLEIGDNIYRVLATESERGGEWTPTTEDGVATWLAGSYINAVFCVPPDATPLLMELARGAEILIRPASGSLRRYEIIRSRVVGRQQTEVLDQRRAGLTLILCGGDGNERQIVEAVYRPEQASYPTGSLGGELELPGTARIRLREVQIITATEQLPSGMALAELRAEITSLGDTLGWSDMAEQLIVEGLAAENVERPSSLPPQKQAAAQFRYLVPRDGAAASWRITSAAGDTIAFDITIPPAPIDRSAPALTAHLASNDVRVLNAPGDRSARRLLQITVALTATGSEVVDVRAEDVAVWAGSRTLPLEQGSTPLPLLLQPGESRRLTLTVLTPDLAVIELDVRDQRWRITLP